MTAWASAKGQGIGGLLQAGDALPLRASPSRIRHAAELSRLRNSAAWRMRLGLARRGKASPACSNPPMPCPFALAQAVITANAYQKQAAQFGGMAGGGRGRGRGQR